MSVSIAIQAGKIYESQRELIQQRFNSKVANAAFYQIEASVGEERLTVTTRVPWTRKDLLVKDRTKRWYQYLPKPCLLTSSFLPNGSIMHQWEGKP